MNKRFLVLFLLLAAALPTAAAAPTHTDQWLITNAIQSYKAQHPEHNNIQFTATITSGWHTGHAPPHKHVTLTASYGYHDTGYIEWSGRSYDGGGIFTMSYTHIKAEPYPECHQIIAFIQGASYAYYDHDAGQWVYNQPVCIRNRGSVSLSVALTVEDIHRVYTVGPNMCLAVHLPYGVSHDVTWTWLPII